MKKLKILFDAEVLIPTWSGESIGTGIYYTAYNIFQQLLQRKDIEIYVYSSTRNFGRLRYILEDKYPGFPFRQLKLDWISELFTRCQYYLYRTARRDNLSIKVKRVLIKYFFQIPIRKINNIFKTYRHITDSFDCYFSPVYKTPWYVEKNNDIKKFIVLYDTIPLIIPSISKLFSPKSWYMNLIKQINERDYYFAISNSAKKDFIKNVTRINKDKVSVIPLAANKSFYLNHDSENNKVVRDKYKIPLDKKYFLSLCTIEPRKNLIFTVRNFLKFIEKNNIKDLTLVLAGGHWKKFSPEVVSEIKKLCNSRKEIIQTGYIDEKDLATLYSNAECFVYPSLYEGFGLPPLEAMQCGTPVITSNTSSLPEVVGDAAIMIDPHDDNALIQAYERMYYDDSFRDELSKKGIERAKLFSWEKCADIIVNKMKEVCGEA